MEEEYSLATSRSKRQKIDRNGRFAALEKFKQMKGKNKYVVDEIKNVYDEVDEREYSKKVLQRQDDDWIVDDGGGGYVEDGREIFDDDLDEESVTQSAKRKAKDNKKHVGQRTTSRRGNIQSLLANMPSKKKTTEMKAEADQLLDDLMGEIDADPKPQSSKISSKEYLKSLNNSSKINSPKPKTVVITQSIKRQRSPPLVYPKHVTTAPAPLVTLIKKEELSQPTAPVQPKETIMCEATTTDISLNQTEEVIHVDEPSVLEDDFIAGDDDFDNLSGLTADDVKPINDVENKGDKEPAVQENWFEEDWNAGGDVDNIETSVVVDTSILPLTTNDQGEKVFRFFWWDAYEDPYKQPGTIFLFGKVYVESAKAYVSCCVSIKNIPRRVFLLPRERKFDLSSQTEKNEVVTLMDVYQEFNDKVANSNKIMNFKSRKVQRKYAFDLSYIPAESDYLEVKYPASHPRLDPNLQGETFSKVFGSNTSALELFLLERKIKGPCWLDVQAPQSMAPCSWCKVEVACNKPEDITVSPHIASPPPIIVMSVNIRTVLNTKSMQNEVIMISCLVHTKFMVNKPAPDPGFEQHFCAFTRPSDVPWPFNLKKETTMYKGTRLHQHESERSLLGFFLTKIFLLDPDLIVGHDLYGFTLDTLIHRIEHHKVANWSRLGRLKRSVLPTFKGKTAERNLASGRLVCDTMISSRELIRARSYDMDTLCKQVLRIPENKRQDFTMEEIKAMYGQAQSVVSLINATMQDANFVLRLMYELNVLPLALQITNIAGNLMARTLLGGRSERNEYLLLHAFTEKDFIVPDKVIGKRKAADSEIEENTKRTKKKPEYAGGLVLDPKKGFYDKYILLMDFNSLYPSIIQEYNICFTTVIRTENSDQEPELPAAGLPLGILPIEIRKLVDSRRQVKGLMKSPDLSVEQRMQYNIRQTALKLTANSMYGCLGFAFSRFYAKPLAALVTSRGREILMNTRDIVQRMTYDVIYGDTDSIMINSNCVDYDQVFSIGNKIKLEINKMYKHIELEVDGVFKYMLLLKKKKYAAIVLNKKPNGELIATQEYKGLDIVRRDWSQLSAEIGRFALNQILSEGSQEDRIATIRTHLEKVANDLRESVVPTSLLAISKQLAKNPEDYPDRKSLPHLQVAMRINARGGKKLKAGDTVSYVICDDGTNAPPVQRAYHVDEVKANDKLLIDVKYYLSQQIHPVVSRLCEPIDGLDAAFIAESLGLDPSSYRRAAAQRAQVDDVDDGEYTVIDDVQSFKQCDKFSFTCANEACKTTIYMDSPMHDNYLALSKCRNASCQTPPTEYLPSIQNNLQATIRSYVNKLYENWLICEDPACPNRTRRVPMQFVNSFPVCSLCRKGLMYREFSNADLYYQLKYFAFMFNTKTVKQQMTAAVENAYKSLFGQVEETLELSSYRIMDFSKLFKFALTDRRGTIMSDSQRSIVNSQKIWSNV